jgi:hypothetical protein
MERVLKAEEAREQFILSIQEIPTKEELDDFWIETKRVLSREVKKQKERFVLTQYTY